MTKTIVARKPMSAAGADLFDEMQMLVRRMHRRSPHAHLHWCACGDAFACTQEPDRCAVPADWRCPKCEQESYDDYISQLEAR